MNIQTLKQLIRNEAIFYNNHFTPTSKQVIERRALIKSGIKIDGYVKKGSYHTKFQNRLSEMASELGAVGKKEFKVKSGYIDVLWKSTDKTNLIAFEIDTSMRKKSIRKLFEAEAKYRIWICSAQKISMSDLVEFGEVIKDKIIDQDGKEIHCIII